MSIGEVWASDMIEIMLNTVIKSRIAKMAACLLLVFLLSMAVTSFWSVKAAGAVTSSRKGLTLSPLRNELNIAPGTSLERKLRVTNSTDKPVQVTFSAEEFNVTNQAYDYAFFSGTDLTKWVIFQPKLVEIPPNKTEQIAYTIGVPLEAESGGRYISLFASADAGENKNGVISRQRVGSLVYLTVSGDVSRTGKLLSLSSPWAMKGDSEWNAVIGNSGTTHFRSRYDVEVQSVLRNKAITKVSGDALILRSSVRLISDALAAPKFPGVYRVVYTIGLGDTPSVRIVRYVVYMPPLAVIVIGLFVILAGVVVVRITARR